LIGVLIGCARSIFLARNVIFRGELDVSKYDSFRHLLETTNAPELVLSFHEIESTIGSPLPPSAHQHRAW
jgi:hypothetical protein